MSNFRMPYANSSSQHLSSYPPQPEHPQDDDEYKIPYDDSIIDGYAHAEVELSRHSQHLKSQRSLHLVPPENQSWQQPHYPLSQKPSFLSDRTSGLDSEFGSHDGGSSMAYSLPQTKEKVEPPRTFWQTIIPDSMACRLYVLTVIIEMIIDVSVEAWIYMRFRHAVDDEDTGTRRLPVYLGIFAFAHLFQFAMALDAVYARNTLQFIFLTVFNAMLLVYGVVQISEISDLNATGISQSNIPVSALTTTIPIVIGVAEIAYVALGWKIWSEFGWKVYKLLGADRRVKRMFAHYQIFVCLIKFDVFFFIGFSVQLIWLVLNRTNWEWYVTCAALPLSFLLLVEGLMAARQEHKAMMQTFMAGCVGAMVYFVYKLYKIILIRTTLGTVFKSLAIFAVIAIFLLLLTFIMGVVVLRNFGAGLKYHMTKSRSNTNTLVRRGTEHQTRHSVYPMSANPNRMSID
ncbi:hypothetical protein BD410DRAFT_818288 [Rickenella mellea]|uniref:Uncharacterized protein n=1 Tax=Rickenella mellea TaxID=50990 RepID=A0A4Y7QMG2_9AGAM|nr:hypothetical protein BD410DRAFT_818288 [Rickenella mellea]